VGGVEVTIPQAISDNMLTLQAGKQTIDGKTAMLYSRYLKDGRASEDEWGRLDRQALVFKALATKMFQPKSLFKATDLFDQSKQSVVTDLSVEQITALACMGNEVGLEKVSTSTIAKEQLNILADETMIIKDTELGPVKKTLDGLFGLK
jgi:anionic cell wall polymer biosynthesis LytR-Cps2A-Psr (LCP) family protein